MFQWHWCVNILMTPTATVAVVEACMVHHFILFHLFSCFLCLQRVHWHFGGACGFFLFKLDPCESFPVFSQWFPTTISHFFLPVGKCFSVTSSGKVVSASEQPLVPFRQLLCSLTLLVHVSFSFTGLAAACQMTPSFVGGGTSCPGHSSVTFAACVLSMSWSHFNKSSPFKPQIFSTTSPELGKAGRVTSAKNVTASTLIWGRFANVSLFPFFPVRFARRTSLRDDWGSAPRCQCSWQCWLFTINRKNHVTKVLTAAEVMQWIVHFPHQTEIMFWRCTLKVSPFSLVL